MSVLDNPAESLLGITLDDGWKVYEKVKKKPDETGGHFSVCYLVEKNGKKAFLKALDLTDAMNQPDFIAALNDLTSAFIFERNLLYKCKERHLSKIVVPLEHGQFSLEGYPPYLTVYYIIFEMADSNLRKQIANMKIFDLAWILRSLHNTAVALEQLHKAGIAHQDLKPSNILIFKKESKVADLGCSSDISTPSANDTSGEPAGDKTYAPFELYYNLKKDFQLRYSSDLYHLGSLVFFYFFRLSLQSILEEYIINNDLNKNLGFIDFYSDLPFFQQAFTYAIDVLYKEICKYSVNLSKEIIPLVKMLCEIDPYKRGHIENRRTKINQYSLERFISSFDLLAKKAEYRFYEHD